VGHLGAGLRQQRWSRRVLIADGLACALAAGTVLGTHRLGSALEPISRARAPIALGLSVTSALLLSSAGRAQVRDADLEAAAIVNFGWVAACAMASARTQTPVSAALIAATAAFDAAAGVAQWILRSDADVAECRHHG